MLPGRLWIHVSRKFFLLETEAYHRGAVARLWWWQCHALPWKPRALQSLFFLESDLGHVFSNPPALSEMELMCLKLYHMGSGGKRSRVETWAT